MSLRPQRARRFHSENVRAPSERAALVFQNQCADWGRKMETGRDLSVLQNEHRFEKSGDARGSFQMAKVSFDRTNRQRRGSISAKSFRECMRLDRIANRRPSAVRFDEADRLGRDSSIPAGISHESRLRLRAGQRDAVGVSILIDRRPKITP
jgi:hypothetical protein